MKQLIENVTGLVLVDDVVAWIDDCVTGAKGEIAQGKPFENAALFEDGVKVYPLNEVEAYTADLAANASRYVLENQYIILCDALRQALGHTPDQTAIHEADFPVMMVTLKAGSEPAYNTLRDAFALVTAKLATYEQKWMDTVCYHPQPELQAASLAIMELAK